MEKLVKGVHQFQKTIFTPQRELFEHLARGQAPDTLFITCSDSRVMPNQFTMTEAGELFIMRNAGNIIPPYGAATGGEGATIEYAVTALGVAHIIVCGHSHCGAVTALLQPEVPAEMPAVKAWLAHAETTRRIMRQAYANLSAEARLDVAVQENVLCQLENLRTHPAVGAGLATGKLHLHGWVYEIDRGQVLAYDPERGQFVPISEDLRGMARRPPDRRVTPRDI
jgi:carbonic anhydrase